MIPGPWTPTIAPDVTPAAMAKQGRLHGTSHGSEHLRPKVLGVNLVR